MEITSEAGDAVLMSAADWAAWQETAYSETGISLTCPGNSAPREIESVRASTVTW